ncbi:MAG: hypothetical protein FWF29_08235, partial [Treponema sp.]|nr:hypothetical protein [Treponema sp.]
MNNRCLSGILPVLAVVFFIFSACGNFNSAEIKADVSQLSLTAATNHPNSNLFSQNSTDSAFLEFTVGKIDTTVPATFNVDYTITDVFGNIISTDSVAYNTSDGASQMKQVPIDVTHPGYFTVNVSIKDGPVLNLPVLGTRPRNYLCYAVVPDITQRRLNNFYMPTADDLKTMETAHPSTPVSGVDKYMYFGMSFAVTDPYDTVVDPNIYLGINTSISGELQWMGTFYLPDQQMTDVNKLNQFGLPDYVYENPWVTGEMDPAAFSLKQHINYMVEMLPYINDQLRTAAGLGGAYGGQLNPAGETELVKYLEGLAKIHIVQAAHRPYHYYQILWEPVDWWGAWNGGDESVVRVYQIAYETIHRIYDQRAAGTLTLPDGTTPPADPSWSTRAVVLGPTYSGASDTASVKAWHERMYTVSDSSPDFQWKGLPLVGLANYIDGFSIHPYNDYGDAPTANGPDNQYAETIRQLMDQVNGYYDARDPSTHPKYFDKLVFWGTELGVKEGSRGNGPQRHAQRQTRQSLILMGEGFDSNNSFCFADTDTTYRYGFFYNCTTMRSSLDQFGPWAISPKPAASAYAAMSWLLSGYRTQGRVTGLGANNWGYEFKDTIDSNDVIYA